MVSDGENLIETGTTDVLYSKEFWQTFYGSDWAYENLYQTTPFATFCDYVWPPQRRILEIGCGNGRDTLYFAQQGHNAFGIDCCQAAIDIATINSTGRYGQRLTFACQDVEHIAELPFTANVAYMRWFLHAVPQHVQDNLLRKLEAWLWPNSVLCLEVKVANDDAQGHVETFDGHYRRLLHPKTLLTEIEAAGFTVEYTCIGYGLAVWLADDPKVMRVIARKKR